MDKPKRYRSFLWPILLIGVGLIWLLNSLGYLPAANLNTLVSLWPLIFIIIGLDILIGRRSAAASAIIGLLVIASVVAILFAAPALNLPTTGNLQSKQIFEPRGNATSAVVDLHLSSMPTRIHPLNGTDNLLVANIDYFGTLDYSATGDSVRRISLSQHSSNVPFEISIGRETRWDIGLSQSVPFDLSVDGGSGSAVIDLTGVQLSSFKFDQGSGSFNVTLPMNPNEYTVQAIGGSGSMRVNLPVQTNLTLHLTGHSGSITMNAPGSSGVRLEILNSGSGSVAFIAHGVKVSSNGDKEGVWETQGYDSAVYKLHIICDDLGSGSFSIH